MTKKFVENKPAELAKPSVIEFFENRFGAKAKGFGDVYAYPLMVSFEGYFRSICTKVNDAGLDQSLVEEIKGLEFGPDCLLDGRGFWHLVYGKLCLIFEGSIWWQGQEAMRLEGVHLIMHPSVGIDPN